MTMDMVKHTLSYLIAKLIDEEISLMQTEQAESAFIATNCNKFTKRKSTNVQSSMTWSTNQSESSTFNKSKIPCYSR